MNSFALDPAVYRRKLLTSDKGKSSETVDRRSKARYPIKASAQCRLLKGTRILECAEAAIRSISSDGLLLETEVPLAIGDRLEVAMDWPALLDDPIGLRLVVTGLVLRIEIGSAAVQIDRYEFRTSGSAPEKPVSPSNSMEPL